MGRGATHNHSVKNVPVVAYCKKEDRQCDWVGLGGQMEDFMGETAVVELRLEVRSFYVEWLRKVEDVEEIA